MFLVVRDGKLRLPEHPTIDLNFCNNLFKYDKTTNKLVHNTTGRGIFCDEEEKTCYSRPAGKFHFV